MSLNIHRSAVLTALTWLVPRETDAVSAHSGYTIQPCTMPQKVRDNFGVHRTRRDGSSFTWHQPCQRCKHNTLIDIQKRAIKKLFTHAESHVSAASLLKSGEQRYIKAIINNNNNMGAGIAQWLERRTRDRKVAGSNPCRSGGRIFFSRVNFLC